MLEQRVLPYRKRKLRFAINEVMRLKTKDARFFYHAGMIEKGLGNKKAATDLSAKGFAEKSVV